MNLGAFASAVTGIIDHIFLGAAVATLFWIAIHLARIANALERRK